MLAVLCVLSCLRGVVKMGFGLPVVFRHAGDAVAKKKKASVNIPSKNYGVWETMSNNI